MTTLSPASIASWDEGQMWESQREKRFLREGVIATEVENVPQHVWEQSFDALLGLLRTPERMDDGLSVAPSRNAVKKTLDVLRYLQQQFPSAPPTLITLEPGGGIIIERRVESPQGETIIGEWTVYNDGSKEFTGFRAGRVEVLVTYPAL